MHIEDQVGARADAVLGLILGSSASELLADSLPAASRCLSDRLSSADQAVAAETARELCGVLWPPDGEPPAEWWHTPLGRACAAGLAIAETRSVAPHLAAVMLGINRARVYQLVNDGVLQRHPDGRLDRRAVLKRVASHTKHSRPEMPRDVSTSAG